MHIKEAMDQAGIPSNTKLAKLIGTSPASVGYLVKGEKVPRREKAEKLAEALDLDRWEDVYNLSPIKERIEKMDLNHMGSLFANHLLRRNKGQ